MSASSFLVLLFVPSSLVRAHARNGATRSAAAEKLKEHLGSYDVNAFDSS